jgi:hypothetical protein
LIAANAKALIATKNRLAIVINVQVSLQRVADLTLPAGSAIL